MKQKIYFYIVLILLLFAGIAGGLYIYTSRNTASEVFTADNGTVKSEQVDETVLSPEPTLFTNSGPAPEFVGLTNWINSEGPQTIESLKGKVVLVHFWTYSCIDCTRAIPYISKWYKSYGDQNFVVIGIHTPQYVFEKVANNVTNATKGLTIPYPVAQDNDYKTWSAYRNQFWPAMYLIDQDGNIVYSQVGGGKYGQMEKAIRTVLGLEGTYIAPELPAATNPEQTPTVFTGLTKLGSSFGGTEKPDSNDQIYLFPKKLAKNKFALEGSWKFNQESAIHTKGYGRLLLQFNAASLSMVAQSGEPVNVKVYVDDLLVKGVVVRDQNEYQLFESLTPGPHTLRLEIPDNTIQISSFLFK